MALNDLVLWGGAGQAKVLNEAFDKLALKLVLIVDNRKIVSPFLRVPVVFGKVGFRTWLGKYSGPGLSFAIAIGGSNGKARIELADYLILNGLAELTITHPTSFVAKDAEIGSGCQILAMSSVCAYARIGRQVIVNTRASVDHECIIEDGVHVGPGAVLAGAVTVKKHAFIGAGAVVLPNLTIGENTIIGAGSVVTKSIAANQVTFGNPARSRPNNSIGS